MSDASARNDYRGFGILLASDLSKFPAIHLSGRFYISNEHGHWCSFEYLQTFVCCSYGEK